MPNEEPNHADRIEARYWEIQKHMDMLEFVVLPLPSRDAITCAFVFTPHKRRARIISGDEGFIIRDPKQRYPETSVITADFVRTLKGVTSDDKELLLIYVADEAASDAAAFRAFAPALWADLLTVMNCRLASPLISNLALPNAEPLYLIKCHPNPERYLTEVLGNLQKVLLTEKRPRTLNCRSGATLMRKLIAFCAEEVARAGRECKARRIKISRGLTDPANEAVKRVRATPKKIAREPRTLASTPAKLIEAAITPEKRLEYIKVTDNQCRRGLYVALSGDPLAVPMLFALEERLHAATRAEHKALHGADIIPTVDTTGVFDPEKESFTITPAALFRAFAPDGISLPNRMTPERFVVEKCAKIHDTKITFRYVGDDGEVRRVDDILFGFDRAESEPEKSPLIFDHIKLVLLEPFIEAKNGKKDFTSIDFSIYHRLFAQHLRKEILTSAVGVINYILGYITPEEDHAEALERAGKVAPRTAIEIPLKDFAGAEAADAETRDKWQLLPQHPKQKAAVIEAIARAMSRDWIVTLIESEGELPRLRLEKIPKDSAIETQQETDASGTN